MFNDALGDHTAKQESLAKQSQLAACLLLVS
jgi:hypothetical protein